MRNFASTLVKFSKLSHIQTTIWRPLRWRPPALRGQRGPLLRHCVTRAVMRYIPYSSSVTRAVMRYIPYRSSVTSAVMRYIPYSSSVTRAVMRYIPYSSSVTRAVMRYIPYSSSVTRTVMRYIPYSSQRDSSNIVFKNLGILASGFCQ